MIFTLALRNIWRNRRRTLLTLSAMVLSSSLLILALGIFAGMLRDMLATATEQYTGHIVVSTRSYLKDRDLYSTFSLSTGLLSGVRETAGVEAVSPRLRAFGLISHRQATYPAEILGIRPDAERKVTTLADHMVAGSYLPGNGEGGAIIGQGLAKRLGVGPGGELVFVTQAADGSIANDLLRVTGVFRTGDAAHDNNLVLVELPWLQRIMVLENRIHELALRVDDPMRAAAIAGNLDTRLPKKIEARDWGKLLPEMREAIASFDVSRFIIVLILYAATGLGILNTFFMAVMERTREFGILMAVGLGPWKVRAMVLLETLAMGILSLAFGVGLGLGMSLYMARTGLDLSGWITPITYAGGTILPRLHAVIEPSNLWMPAALLLVVCLLSGFLPANRAARLNPAEAIREE